MVGDQELEMTEEWRAKLLLVSEQIKYHEKSTVYAFCDRWITGPVTLSQCRYRFVRIISVKTSLSQLTPHNIANLDSMIQSKAVQDNPKMIEHLLGQYRIF